jgi:signal transduction histidine kinase
VPRCSCLGWKQRSGRLLHEIRKEGPRASVIFLSDHIDQVAVDAAISAGASDCLQTSNLNEFAIARSIRYAIEAKIKADPVQIEQIVMNLVVNARDAVPDGGKLTIETADAHLDESYTQRHSMVPAGEYVLLAVGDPGEGIAPEHVPHIFEPFYTTKRKARAWWKTSRQCATRSASSWP